MTTTETLTLSAFLTARLDEDEEVAQWAMNIYVGSTNRADWTVDRSTSQIVVSDASPPITSDSDRKVALAFLGEAELERQSHPHGIEFSPNDQYAADHIARHDPARVLAEVEAKRRIVKTQQFFRTKRGAPHHSRGWMQGEGDFIEVDGVTLWGDRAQAFIDDWSEPAPPSDVLRALASVYADHPDFRAEWAL